MFQSFETDYNNNVVVITDDDFVETIVEWGKEFWLTCTEIYERRNLPVAINMFRLFHFWSKKYHFTVLCAIEESKKHNPKHYLFENDIEKYLVLI